MQTPSGGQTGRHFSLVLVAFAAALAAASGPAQPSGLHAISTAVGASLHAPLRVGDRGQRVRDLQYLLSGHRPSHYWRSVHPYGGRIDGVYGPKTRDAVRAAKWRLGMPSNALDGRAGRQLFEILLGKRARPLDWIGRASKRVHAAIEGQTVCSRRLVSVARAELGVHEVPDGSNYGPRVSVYESVTRAYRAPWCASFLQFVLKTAGVGTIDNRSASVFNIVQWAHQRTLLHALPKPGSLVAYLRNLGHIGLVESVTKRGFYSIEGNTSNGVHRRWHKTGDLHTVFIWLPRCSSTTLGRRLASVRASRAALASTTFTVPGVFDAKGIWYDDISATGGFRGDKLNTVPGGPIKVVYLNPRDPRATRTLRDQIVAQGFSVGLVTDPHWYAGATSDPIAYRKQLDSDISRILGGAHDPVMLDFEQLPKVWVQTFLWGSAGTIGYRGRNGLETGGTRPTRDTAYTNEPFQDGSVVPIPDLIKAKLAWFVQLYYGGMQPAEHWWALRQLVLWGYPAEALRPFYDAAHYPPDWHSGAAGALFNSNRLTWLFQ